MMGFSDFSDDLEYELRDKNKKLEELIAKWKCRRRGVCRDIDRINFDKLEGQEMLKAKMESSKARIDEFIADLERIAE